MSEALSQYEYEVLEYINENVDDEGKMHEMLVPGYEGDEIKRYVGMLYTKQLIEARDESHQGNARNYIPTAVTEKGKQVLEAGQK